MHYTTHLIKSTALALLLFSAWIQVLGQSDRYFLESASGNPGTPIEMGIYMQDVIGTAIDTDQGDGFYDMGMLLTFDANLVDQIDFVRDGITLISNPFFFLNNSNPDMGTAELYITHSVAIPITLGGPAELLCTLRVTPSSAAVGQTISFGFADEETFLQDLGLNVLRASLGNLDLSIGSLSVVNTTGVPTINSFAASPTSIEPGASSSLSWNVSDADTVTISDGVGSVNASSGSVSVSPASTTTYTLTATNSSGDSSASATVTVASGEPQISSFTASATEIVAGGSATLSWSTVDADSASLQPGIGNVATSGSQVVSPTSTTTYTLSASSDGGTVEATVTIEVLTGTQILSFSASPLQVEEGGSSTLSWQVAGASSVTLDGVTVASTGSQAVMPTTSTTYRLVASGPLGQSDQATVIVRVSGEATLSLNVSSVDFGNVNDTYKLDLSVNAIGVFAWTLENLPQWLTADNMSGNVDGERAFEVTLLLDRNRLFPGQRASVELSFSSPSVLGATLSVTAERAEMAQEAFLYYPLLEVGEKQAELTVVNLSSDDAELLLQIFQQDGTLLNDPIEASLPALGSYHFTLTFELAVGKFWAVASLTGDDVAPAVTGSVSTRLLDEGKLYGLSADTVKSSLLNVPHIARDTEVFFTHSAIVNLSDQSRVSSVDTGIGFPVANQQPGGQSFFSWGALLGSAINNVQWSRLIFDEFVSMACVGAEVFGFLDLDRTVGVGLNDVGSNQLYFTHIAADLTNFWTGVVVINLANEAVDIHFEAYNTARELIDGGFTVHFAAGEKKTFVALGDRLDFGADAAWLKVTSPALMSGYELFSNPDNSLGDTFAGLEAIDTLSTNLAFSHTEEGTGLGITAVAIINPGSAVANLNFRLVSSNGVVKANVPWLSIQPKGKLITTAGTIFSDSVIGLGDIILVDSDQDIAGFELYGDLSATMGALLATPY